MAGLCSAESSSSVAEVSDLGEPAEQLDFTERFSDLTEVGYIN